VRRSRTPIVFLHGAGFYGQWFSSRLMTDVRRFVRAAPEIRAVALEIVKRTFGGPLSFNAAHVRLGDYADRAARPDVWVSRLESRRFRGNVPLYIATDARGGKTRTTYFAPFTARFRNVSFHNALAPRSLVQAYLRAFPAETRADFFGIVEQHICVLSKRFAGTSFSTFSAHIDFMRGFKAETFPEALPPSAGKRASKRGQQQRGDAE